MKHIGDGPPAMDEQNVSACLLSLHKIYFEGKILLIMWSSQEGFHACQEKTTQAASQEMLNFSIKTLFMLKVKVTVLVGD